MGYYRRRSRWPAYVPVDVQRKRVQKKLAALRKKGMDLAPVQVEGTVIAKTFWGKAWCKNLEKYQDYEHRLPRGRSYLRNGALFDLRVESGKVIAQVMGSSLYEVSITICPMKQEKWLELVRSCSGQIDSLVELLQGKFSKNVMAILTEDEKGLFPQPHEIAMKCSCLDWAGMCKHVAAALYGIGSLLDTQPELLFTLRGVNHLDLLCAANADAFAVASNEGEMICEGDLSSIFGIDLDDSAPKKKTVKKRASTKTVKRKKTAV